MARTLKETIVARLRPARPDASVAGEAGADFYDAAYSEVDEYRKPYWKSRYYFVWTVIADRLRRTANVGVLEIGCGSGQLANLIIEQGIRNYLGFDF